MTIGVTKHKGIRRTLSQCHTFIDDTIFNQPIRLTVLHTDPKARGIDDRIVPIRTFPCTV